MKNNNFDRKYFSKILNILSPLSEGLCNLVEEEDLIPEGFEELKDISLYLKIMEFKLRKENDKNKDHQSSSMGSSDGDKIDLDTDLSDTFYRFSITTKTLRDDYDMAPLNIKNFLKLDFKMVKMLNEDLKNRNLKDVKKIDLKKYWKKNVSNIFPEENKQIDHQRDHSEFLGKRHQIKLNGEKENFAELESSVKDHNEDMPADHEKSFYAPSPSIPPDNQENQKNISPVDQRGFPTGQGQPNLPMSHYNNPYAYPCIFSEHSSSNYMPGHPGMNSYFNQNMPPPYPHPNIPNYQMNYSHPGSINDVNQYYMRMGYGFQGPNQSQEELMRGMNSRTLTDVENWLNKKMSDYIQQGRNNSNQDDNNQNPPN